MYQGVNIFERNGMKRTMMALVICALCVISSITRADTHKALDIAFVDSFKAMRECSEGQRVGKELDAMRDKLSKEIQGEAQKLTKEDADLKSKASAMKHEMLVKKERDLAKQKRDLEEKVRESEEEIKIVMQQKLEELTVKIEEGIVAVAKTKGVDAVIDKMSGRVMYTKDDKQADITADAINYVNKKTSDQKASATVAKQNDKQKTTAAA